MASCLGACRAHNPILDELGKAINSKVLSVGNKAEIIKVDVDKHRDIVKKWHVDAIPTLFLLKNDSIVLESTMNNALT